MAPSGFVDFSASACAAIVAQRGVQLSLANVEVRNMVADSGAVCMDGSLDAITGAGDAPILTIMSSVFKSNAARMSGAAVSLVSGDALTVSGTRFEANKQQSQVANTLHSSAVLVSSVKTLIVDRSCAFNANLNAAPYPCPGPNYTEGKRTFPATVWAEKVGTAEFSNVSISKNVGVGLWLTASGSLKMVGSIFIGNVGKLVGGMATGASAACLSSVTFDGNTGQEVVCGDNSAFGTIGGALLAAGTDGFSANKLTFKKNVAAGNPTSYRVRVHSLAIYSPRGAVLTNTIIDTPVSAIGKNSSDVLLLPETKVHMCRTTFLKSGSRVPYINYFVDAELPDAALAICPAGSQGSYNVSRSLPFTTRDCSVCSKVGTKECATQPKWQDWVKGILPSSASSAIQATNSAGGFADDVFGLLGLRAAETAQSAPVMVAAAEADPGSSGVDSAGVGVPLGSSADIVP
jgi:hypothetical protein